ncbi:hypothetical protein [Lacrimispora amygdalina]|uniref:hypothetical protein n=1 Tax=Lacrimispora amygdalina TaxID=253257 RepID=UPI000BE3D411|nr:hypothetical protein [Lacrimispora amygdalina]
MAKIFKTNSQEQALKDIVDSLKIVSSLNELLKDEDVSECKIKVMGTTKCGSINEQIPIPYTMIASPLKDYRKKIVKETLDKSKTYSIKLEENEEEILGIRAKKDVEVKDIEVNSAESNTEIEVKESTNIMNTGYHNYFQR